MKKTSRMNTTSINGVRPINCRFRLVAGRSDGGAVERAFIVRCFLSLCGLLGKILGEDLRDDDVFIANIYKQDFPTVGFTSQATVVHNRNRETDENYFDNNGFLQRPAPLGNGKRREYDVTYLGYNGDGHFGRLNLTASWYYATGQENRNIFHDDDTTIDAFFVAGEASMDFDWIRIRVSGLYASGDKNPFDDNSNNCTCPVAGAWQHGPRS